MIIYSPTNATENKGVIQFDLDESCQVIGSVLEQSRDDYIIYLPVVTRRH